MIKIEKVVIVGGGSSGWMTASSLLKHFPDIDLTLIESSDIPTIGVGESTIGSINYYLKDLGLKDEDWMEYCNATYKTSIDFTNFGGDEKRVRYPFGKSTWLNNYRHIDWFMKKALIGADNDEYADFALGTGQLIRDNKLTEDESVIRGWDFKSDTAYHMDAGLFGDYLKKHYCKPRGINHIVDNVISVEQCDDGNIDSVVTENNGKLSADLFIDCTGFKSLLLTETLNEPFISFKDKLINDRAVAIRIPYIDKEIEMEHSTNATTLSSGWVWNIPLWNRIGTGYVYSSQFLSEEEAEKEFKEYLINDRDIPHDREEIENIKAFHVKINPGIHERNWVKNVCAIGLSNGFIEPLESTGLMLTHETIFELIKTLQRRNGKVNGYDKSIFNTSVRMVMDEFAGFIALHFALAERDDTPYWQYVTEELDYINDNSSEWTVITDIVPKEITKNNYWGKFDNLAGTPFIMAGFNYNPYAKFYLEKEFGENLMLMTERSKQLKIDLEKEKEDNKEYIHNLPTHYEFLKNKIYN
jgi:flavin-dependent dehydrogenase